MKDVTEANNICYDEILTKDPRGNEYGQQKIDVIIPKIYGNDIEDYYKKQHEYIDTILDNHPTLGLKRIGVPPPIPSSLPDVDSDENSALDEILQEDEESPQSTIPAWQKIDKKKDAANKIFKFKGDNQNYNYIDVRSKLGDYLRTKGKKAKNEVEKKRYDELRDLHTKLVQEYSSFEENSFQTDIIDKYELYKELANTTTKGGRKSKRTNKTRKYRSRKL